MISEVKMVSLGVRNLSDSIKYYRLFGYEVLGEGRVAGKGLERAWRMPAGLTGKYVMVGLKGIESGMLRFLEFDRPGKRIWEDYTKIQDIGPYCVNIRVRDLNAFWPRLIAAGATPVSPPAFWELEQSPVWESKSFDINGTQLDVWQADGKFTEAIGALTHESSEVQTIAIRVPDAEKAKTFYQGLGFSIFFDKIVAWEKRVSDLLPGTKLHNVNFIKRDCSPRGRVEVMEFVGLPGVSTKDRAVPPNYGILSFSLETDSLKATSELVKNLGGEMVSGPVPANMPPLGKIELATFYGHAGELIEFYQKV